MFTAGDLKTLARTHARRAMRSTLAGQLDAVRSGRMGEEFKQAASQILGLKEAVAFTEGCVGVWCLMSAL